MKGEQGSKQILHRPIQKCYGRS